MESRRPKFAWSRDSYNASVARIGDQEIPVPLHRSADCVHSHHDEVAHASTEADFIQESDSLPVAAAEFAHSHVRSAKISVHPEVGAGLEVSWASGSGYLIEAIAELPGQPGLALGDFIIGINGQSLALQCEDTADDILAAEICDGVELILASSSPVDIPISDEKTRRDTLDPLSVDNADAVLRPDSVDDVETCLFRSSAKGELYPPGDRLIRECDGLAPDQATISDACPGESIPDFSNESVSLDAAKLSLDSGVMVDVDAKEEGVDDPRAKVLEHGTETATACSTAPRPEALPLASQMFGRHKELPQEGCRVDIDSVALSKAALAEAFLDALATEPCSLGRESSSVNTGGQLPPQPRFASALNSFQPPVPSSGSGDPESTCASHLTHALGSAVTAPDYSPTCKVAELWDLLSELLLQEYFEVAKKWCVEMGAVSIEEIAETVEDFAEDIALKPIEKRRLQKWASKFLESDQAHRWTGHSIEASPASFPQRSDPLDGKFVESASLGCSKGTGSEHPSWRQDCETTKDVDAIPPGLGAEGALCNPQEDVLIYASHSVRLAMDKQGNTGLELRWDKDWGVAVTSVEPLPGQPGLKAGDFIVAIDECSLRNRSHEETDQIFSDRLRAGSTLSVLSPTVQEGGGGGPRPRFGPQSGSSMPRRGGAGGPRGIWKQGWSNGRRAPGRGGFDANRMWKNFRAPAW